MKNFLRNTVLLLLSAVVSLSCTKEIELDLEGHEQKIVIEGSIGTEIGQNLVKISKSKAFNDPNPIQYIDGATVTITDLATGTVYPMFGSTDGLYGNPDLQGVEEHTYELKVTVEGKTYTSQSTIPKNVSLDDLTQVGSTEDVQFGFTDLAKLKPFYHDPGDRENFYQFVIARNDTILEDIILRDDVVYNGLDVSAEIYVEARKDDTILVDFQGIDKPAYNFLFGFQKNIFQTSGTPANPVSNISNGALGYFKAHNSNFKEIIVK